MSQSTGTQSPRNNVEWQEAIVKWTRYEYVAMYDYPTTENSEHVMEIFVGDMVQISKRYRREDWCLVQIGHVLGWVFLKDVRFIVPRIRTPRPANHTQRRLPKVDAHKAVTMPSRNMVFGDGWDDDMDTSPALQSPVIKPGTGELDPQVVEESSEKAAKKSMLNKLINFFQK